MKFTKVLPIVLGLLILQACGTPKKSVLWVSGVKSNCNNGTGESTCLNVIKGDSLKQEKWEHLYATIDGFEFEEGYMKKIEVKKEKLDPKEVAADASSIKYTLIKELVRKEDPRAELKGHWTLDKLEGIEIDTLIALPTLEIDLTAMRISGNGGCNLYSAEIAKLTAEKIEIKSNLGTLMECGNDNIEEEYHEKLPTIHTYEVKGHRIYFYNQEGDRVMSFVRTEIPGANHALNGEWKNISIYGKNIDTSHNVPQITFNIPNNRFSGTNGCNYFNGQVNNLTDTDILFGPVAATKKMCPEMETPDLFSKAIAQVMTYEIEGDQLFLMDGEENVLLEFSR